MPGADSGPEKPAHGRLGNIQHEMLSFQQELHQLLCGEIDLGAGSQHGLGRTDSGSKAGNLDGQSTSVGSERLSSLGDTGSQASLKDHSPHTARGTCSPVEQRSPAVPALSAVIAGACVLNPGAVTCKSTCSCGCSLPVPELSFSCPQGCN